MDFLNGLTLQDLGKAAVAGVPLIVALLGLSRGPGAARARLRHDVELLEKLPADSTARTKYEDYLGEQIDRFATFETTATRDVSGLVIAGALVIGLGVLTLFLAGLDDWWWRVAAIVPGVLAIAGLSSMYDSAERVPRNAKGKRV